MTNVQPLQAIVGVVRRSNHTEVLPREARTATPRRSEETAAKTSARDKRRKIDPTTCERDYSADELEFMRAVESYKRENRRMFPTCSELLEVVRRLGYVKLERSPQDVRLAE